MFNTVSFLFLDTESKTSREFEHIHIKELMKQFDAKTTADLKIEVELQTILDPCHVCSGQMNVFQQNIMQKLIFIVVEQKKFRF
ncbi:hypothetical protein SAMN05421846_108122 [Chryseobacterium taeanense]|uniref:Uncharacterized protein n=1 Tax=Chryseobacterium taeanense TaxID=311334 RepID=A0A1G8KYR4_9FLAO|nr:hypothetical protein [Chryseobacterium taeanense]SDI48564.1 hypothetical protein SAMN05421846_108122 [Chryseobacterium taeanense]